MNHVELTKLFGRRRTWVAILLLNLLPTIVAALLAWTGIAPRPGTGPAFLSAVMANGSLSHAWSATGTTSMWPDKPMPATSFGPMVANRLVWMPFGAGTMKLSMP